eukprot:4340346-Pleurochrysis_carterae.AAC.1
MSYKWGHLVATLPVTNGTIRHICRMTEILQITQDTHQKKPSLGARCLRGFAPGYYPLACGPRKG